MCAPVYVLLMTWFLLFFPRPALLVHFCSGSTIATDSYSHLFAHMTALLSSFPPLFLFLGFRHVRYALFSTQAFLAALLYLVNFCSKKLELQLTLQHSVTNELVTPSYYLSAYIVNTCFLVSLASLYKLQKS